MIYTDFIHSSFHPTLRILLDNQAKLTNLFKSGLLLDLTMWNFVKKLNQFIK